MPAGSGVIKLTASGVVGESGAPWRVYNIEIDSKSTGGIVQLRNGTTNSSEIHIQAQGTASIVSTPATFPTAGLYFPAGLYASLDSNCNALYVEGEQAATI